MSLIRMIGLEGSGFTIAIGLILLLTGVVMFYCRQKINQCEHKVESMFSLVSEIHEELEKLKKQPVNTQYYGGDANNDTTETTSFSGHPYEELIPVEVDNSNADLNDSSESESDSETDEDEDEERSDYDDVKVVDLGQIEELTLVDQYNDDVTNIVALEVVESESNIEEVETESDESTEEETDANADADVNTDADVNAEVEVEVEANADADDEDEVEVQGEESEVVKLINTNVEMDYSKMQVSALKKMVSERNLATGVAKLRKQELIEILQQN